MPENVVVWIDHREARVLHVRADTFDDATVWVPQHVHHKHPQGLSGAKEHPDDAQRFFHEIARSLTGNEKVLVVGPSTAKLELLRYLHRHDLALEARIVGVETVDHPTDKQLAAYAKQYFHLTAHRSDGHSAPGAAPSR